MSLASSYAGEFASITRLRGKEYFASGAVQIADSGPLFAKFRVRGTGLYSVLIEIIPDSSTIKWECSCPHFSSGNFCKHIWASLLKADRSNLLRPAVFGDKMMVHDAPSLNGEGMSNDEFDEAPVLIESNEPKTWQEKILKAQNSHKRNAVRNALVPSKIGTELPKFAHFAIDLQKSIEGERIQLRFLMQEYLKNGTLGTIRPIELTQGSIESFPDPRDREILWSLLGKTQLNTAYSNHYTYLKGAASATLSDEFAQALLLEISNARKLHVIKPAGTYMYNRREKVEVTPYRFSSEKWNFKLMLKRAHGAYFLMAQLTDGSTLKQPNEILGQVGELVFFDDFMASSNLRQTSGWMDLFKRTKDLEIPEDELNAFLELFLRDPEAPAIELPSEISFVDQACEPPTIRLSVSALADSRRMRAGLEFSYADVSVDAGERGTHIYNIEKRLRLARDLEAEKNANVQFHALTPEGVLTERNFIAAVDKALSLGWQVVADQKKVHAGGQFAMNVASGLDWFDLTVEFDFAGNKMQLPQLMQHLKSGRKLVPLGDGSFGMLPEEWLKKFGALAEMAQKTETGLRLSKIQALFLSSSLEGSEVFRADKKFRSLKDIITELNTMNAREASSAFNGKLRGYQKKGLAWLSLISKHQIGGILADDMGLGKTIQVLALLVSEDPEIIQIRGQSRALPSLVVAPKSLIFNWIKEAEKFTPHLKVLNYTGVKRQELIDRLDHYDIVLTTYQSLRMDIDKLKDREFNFFILDEGHYVKNPGSQAAMACRMIQARRKISLTGTPIENSLTDLFSILSIVTPGLISQAQARRWAKENNPELLRTLSNALRPFILRRTKEQVLKDLPEKSEQILYCELSVAEMKKYNELKTYYWSQLSGKFHEKGLSRSKIDILEALLRLRQAACHQGLLNGKLRDHSSAKFELLLGQLENVIKDGHKALIFSQFTTLLRLFEIHLKKRGINYEYLDGQTVNRQERIEKFQNDHDIKVFLLSLKAGGVGLNLTAADYVFVLDPWWNPAAEAQAIDRTHRIGQNKKVFAYRIIAKDTVEEKILELQKSKRELAKAVISDEKSVLKNLNMSDLEALFQ